MSVRCNVQPEPVYDLTVDDAHEFYAHGILVHNCMDSLRYIALYLNHDKGFDVNATTMRAATRQPTAYERFQAMTAQLRQADDAETTDAPDGHTDDVAIGVARGRQGPSLPFHQRFT